MYPSMVLTKSCKRFLSTGSVNPLSQSMPISKTLVFYLENCSDIISLKKLHASIFVHGLKDNNFLGSKLLVCYAKFGSLSQSGKVFDKFVNKSASMCNSVLVGYFRTGLYREVQWRYSNFRQKKMGLDESVIVICLKSCIALGCLDFGRGVHGDAFKYGSNANPFVGSSLIGLYARYSDIGDASKVFDEITVRDVVVYTSMITGYAQVGNHCAYEAFKVASNMQQEKVDPNRVTLVSLLQTAGQLEALMEGRSIHGYAIRRRIGCLDKVFETSLLDMYIKCGASRIATFIFGKMKIKDIGSWNAIITGYLKLEQPLEALYLFRSMLQENVIYDLITLANGILCCGDLKYSREGKSIHCHITRMGFQLDVVAATALVDMYSKCNNLLIARELFNRIETRDAISYNVMMAGYLQNGFACEAVKIFIEMIGTCTKPNVGSLLCVLAASSDLKDTRRGRCMHGYILRCGFYSNVEVANQIIHMYSNFGSIVYARQVFNRLRNRDLVSWTSMMMGYVHHGQADETIFLFRLMQREKLGDDSVALTSLLQAFCQLGYLNPAREVHCHLYRAFIETDVPVINSLITTYAKCGKLNMARDLFENSSKNCLTSWNAMIAAYGMHGDSINALKLFELMKRENLKPDEITFTSILTACSHTGFAEDGLRVFRSMTEEYYIVPCEEHYGCLVDLLGRAGQLEEAYDLVKCLPARQRASALCTLLAACRVYGHSGMGEVVGKQLLDLEPQNASIYTLMSNLCAEGGRWDEVAKIRAMASEKSLKRTHGCSLIS